jgi:hypothetical protein
VAAIQPQSPLLMKPFTVMYMQLGAYLQSSPAANNCDGVFAVEVLLLPFGDGDGEGCEYDAEIVHLIGVPPLAVPEHPEE